MDIYVEKSGKLKKDLLPAVYFDTSVVIDYWIAEGTENEDFVPENEKSLTEYTYGPLVKVIKDLLRSDLRIQKVIELRKKIIWEDIAVTPITSQIALWELQEWIAESSFKQISSEIVGAINMQKKGKKEIGNLLRKAYSLWSEERRTGTSNNSNGTTGIELLMQDTWLNYGFAYSHGLKGICVSEIVNFRWPPVKRKNANLYTDPLGLAYFQLGIADILHILFAEHLGCKYFASFDSDFDRVKEFCEDSGLTILTKPEEIISILTI